ncbi:DNA glycosylase AlkZ-like family protein [Nocardioides insulae]|uniref:DNA glycosylase AlkZ-like family protein n=1 Tax=Nocardioides insulae TaxID=394734 RepID=UPI00048B9C48
MSRAQARRVALAAQGFLDRPHATPTLRTLSRTVERTGVLQVDSVNVLQRAHFLPLYSRMGPYDLDLMRRASETRPRRLVEYWAHVQAYMPVELWPVMQFRMEQYRRQRGKWSAVPEDPRLEDAVRQVVKEHGPLTAREAAAHLGDTGPRRTEHWGWNWSDTRRLLDHFFTAGEVAIAGRSRQFEVRYDLPERVLPAHVLALPVPDAEEAHRELVRRAARSHGVATIRDLADYYRMSVAEATTAVRALVESGEVEEVGIEGVRRPAYLHREARLPRRIGARTLLSPFDPVVWARARTEELFGFRYRIEIYTPADQRVHGYYVLPFLLGERLVARVDLKADRTAGVLLVRSAHAEAGLPAPTRAEVPAELAAELTRMAGWLGLGDIVVLPHGDLAPDLCGAVTGGPGR